MTKRNGLGKFVRDLDLVELFLDCLPELKDVNVFQGEELLGNSYFAKNLGRLEPKF